MHVASRPGIRSRRLLLLAVIGGLGSACVAKPALLEGNADSAVVSYGRDLTGATALAKRHCAGFERVAQLRETGENLAYFDCVRP